MEHSKLTNNHDKRFKTTENSTESKILIPWIKPPLFESQIKVVLSNNHNPKKNSYRSDFLMFLFDSRAEPRSINTAMSNDIKQRN